MGEVDPTTDINKIIADLKTAGTNLKVGSTTTLAAGSQAAVSQTIANGQNTINFAIPRGAQGIQGPQGVPGERGPEGQQGIQGQNGNDGHTPVKGVDYWTDADKQSIYGETKQYVDDAILNGKW